MQMNVLPNEGPVTTETCSSLMVFKDDIL
jgi:hypothetical protein